VVYFAHSPKQGIPAQEYQEHIGEVKRYAVSRAEKLCKHIASVADRDLFIQTISAAAEFHDLGKLDEANQEVLSGKKKSQKLPLNHVDAGVAYFLPQNPLVAALIQAHHRGYVDFTDILNKGLEFLRDSKARDRVNQCLAELVNKHCSVVKQNTGNIAGQIKNGSRSLFLRLLLSCLADADHTDTARHYRNYSPPKRIIKLRPVERLNELNRYVGGLKNNNDQRSQLRAKMYAICRDADTGQKVNSCDSPVGSGKTTALMAHLLKQAEKRKLRHIFVVLPFTNIIQQSVAIYRKALVLRGEKAEEVVAELHHRADFIDVECRHLTALWQAPIIVTTAVAFFETLASNSPAALRRLHNLPSSAVFVDEAHAALPAKLLPLAWHWINLYSAEWNCYWVLASGSLNRFWEIEEIRGSKSYHVPEIVDRKLRQELQIFEKRRIVYKSDLTARNTAELANWIKFFPGPRLVIVNTVQSAAVLAEYFAVNFGLKQVIHLSTALTPVDREKTLKRIKKRLANAKTDDDWTLIATSCVEAGVDFSFRTGFRELGSLVSLLQAAGRINREGEYPDAEIWTFKIAEDRLLKIHPGLRTAAAVLENYIKDGKSKISPELSTNSIRDEIVQQGCATADFKKLLDNEKQQRFPLVDALFKVIDTDTQLVVVDKTLIEKMKRHEKVNWQELQKKSVRIWKYIVYELSLPEILPEIYEWKYPYDNFLGYMRGMLPVKKFKSGTGEGTVI
jgi:CRISPR-associated endonuclease Cas3-HD